MSVCGRCKEGEIYNMPPITNLQDLKDAIVDENRIRSELITEILSYKEIHDVAQTEPELVSQCQDMQFCTEQLRLDSISALQRHRNSLRLFDKAVSDWIKQRKHRKNM